MPAIMGCMRSPILPRHTQPGRHGGGVVWLILALAVIVVASMVFLAPDLPRSLLGRPDTPADRGSDPEVKVVAAPLPKPSKPATTPVKAPDKPAPAAPVVVAAPKPEAPVAVKTYPDDAVAASILAEARAKYRAFQWNQAALTAMKVAAMDVSPATRQRAKDIQHGASVLDKLFATLNDEDELCRGYDTHPCLVEVTTHGSAGLAVPIEHIDRPTPLAGDPIANIEKQKREGKVHLMCKGRKKYSPVTLEADAIDAVKAVDLKPIMAQMRADLAARLETLKNGADANQALSWYEAARFAYQNRLDDQVTDLMDKALELDPGLLMTVREDRAATLLGHMLIKLKDGNKPQAATYLATITKRFADTDSGKKAVAYYAGETEKLLALEKAAEARRIAAEQARLKAIKERETALGVKTATVVAKADPTESLDLKPVTGDELVADTMTEDGRKLCSKAIESPVGPDKNKYYKQAYQILFKAKALYADLARKDPGNQGIQTKMITCSQYLYMAKKGLSPF